MRRVPWLAAITLASLSMTAQAWPSDLRFTGACDGSAAVLLDKGLLAVADDEHSLLHVYGGVGGAPVNRDLRAFLGFAVTGKDESKDEADIEGAARVGDRVYWIGSHSHNKNGKPRPERLVLFATTANEALTPIGSPAHSLLDALIAIADERAADGRPTPLAQAIGQLGLAALAASPIAPEAGGINIEGLGAGPDGSLLIGFRSPRASSSQHKKDEPALIIPLLNPKEVVEAKAVPRFGMPISIDLDGLGIRDLLRRSDGSYVVIAGPTPDDTGFVLNTWSGPGGVSPQPIAADLTGLHPEAVVEREGRLLLLSDDGDDRCKQAPVAERSFVGRQLP